MAEQRLPMVDGDDGEWGDLLNQFLEKEHLNSSVDDVLNGGHKNVTIAAGAAGVGLAPLRFASGPLLTTPEVGAFEFNNNNFYLTQTTGAIRKKIAIYDDSSGIVGDIYYRNASGLFDRLQIGTDNQLLQVSSGIPTWSTVLEGAKKITVSTTQPVSPNIGDLWIDSN